MAHLVHHVVADEAKVPLIDANAVHAEHLHSQIRFRGPRRGQTRTAAERKFKRAATSQTVLMQ